MNDLVLKNCKFVDNSDNNYIGIKNGKIAEISKQPLKGDNEVDVKNNFVLPGLIDPHVHFRDPGLTYKESLKTGSLAAANGGFTTILDMPNTIPPTDTAKAFKEKKKIGENKSIVNFGLHAGVKDLDNLRKIAKLNPASFKIFMDLFSDSEIEDMFKNISIINKEYGSKSKLQHIITLHCENKEIIEENTKRLKRLGCTRGNTAIDYSYARPSESELVSVGYATFLAEKYKLSLHICHLSTKKSLDYLKSLKLALDKFDITTEITPHHLLLNNTAFDKFGTMLKTNPPLRPEGENLTISNLKNINMIGTDHAPHSLEEKQKGVWDSSPGIPNLETTLPLLLTEVNKGNIDLKMIPKLMSENPAHRFNIENKGKIKIDYDADLVVVDLKKKGKFKLDEFYTKAEYSPFENCEYKGIATMTICNGNIIMKENYIEDNFDLNNNNARKYVYD
ncbi:dihydroorotase [Methanobrevibacter sp. TMH8]|uniref:dihydroorotase n=1 Tax=Methanobrevibacter sp. TMH8 TaxID=2848611 RepID=UPI001CCCC07E|nr:dihydroorotase [Methanobrevibacter sp. TMH8]MBZ9571230.1 dihydroorotase [Methanobrevibacter sp. TMH8]